MTEPSIFVLLVPDVQQRRSYLKEVSRFEDSKDFYSRAIAYLEGTYLGRRLTDMERDGFRTYLSRIW